MSSKRFPAKLLLFGEYSILFGGKAVAIPLHLFEGELKTSQSPEYASHKILRDFFTYCETYCGDFLDLVNFEYDLSNGLFFDSNIPQGFGLGSSGALVASVYDRFKIAKKKYSKIDLMNLFSLMENFFHSKSSGFDPLVSYFRTPLMLEEGRISTHEKEDYENISFELFLLDSQVMRKSEHLIKYFKEKLKETDFHHTFKEQLLPLSNNLITSWVSDPMAIKDEDLREMSHLEYQLFAPMTPPKIKEIWQNSLQTKHTVIKLCGAGGGGYFLGFSFDRKETLDLCKNQGIRFIN